MADLRVYDIIDSTLCYSVLFGITVYSLLTYAREVFILRKGYTLRTFILLFTFINSFLLATYTICARHIPYLWTDQIEATGDIITTSIGFLQFFFVIYWFVKASQSVDLTEELNVCSRFDRHNSGILIVTSLYIIVAAMFIVHNKIEQFYIFQDIYSIVASIALLIYGIFYFILVHVKTDLLDVPVEVYSVLKRSKYTCYILLFSSLFYTIISMLSISKIQTDVAALSVMESKHYICHETNCLVSLIIRTIIVVALPNWAIAWTFSSPTKDDNVFLLPLNRSTNKYRYSQLETQPEDISIEQQQDNRQL